MKKNNDDKKPQKATADDVARLADVSKWTVLRAFKTGASISPEAREKVMAAANTLGFRPNLLARGLKQSKTNIIGIVADEFSNPHTLRMLKEATQQLNERGYMSLLLNIESAENYQSVLQMAGQLQVDGIIYLATIVSDELLVIAKSLHHIRAVHVFRNTDTADVEVVNVDGFAAGQTLGQLLLDQGYQRYGYMKGPDTASSHLLRMEGYATSLDRAGQSLDTLLIAGSYDRDLAYRTMRDYLRSTPPSARIDALFCENDVLAFGAIEAMRDFDPQLHIGVVGFDDIDEAHASTWQLTSWDQRADRQIAEAISRLLDNETHEEGDWKYGELRLRQSHIKPA
ncbi:LacI family DNA-binding transcriptional regulator [Pantoea sp. At-9b]|uniref:LacI family DNA-binding transcriptional regulator n=1 Tax=Pantoea sp. (strain At-9b) TaxID=592316 RepID=UPI0001F25FE4|nr:LacI family DNA-binding transcriptional regulator [Pantoea sp. At-9b]ADU71908.1 transcriptional regulator, LacI family [Pantoea sp. At-9b]